MEVGIYTDLSNENYHKANGISSSGISLLRKAPAIYYDTYILGNRKPEKETFKVGTLVHLLVFEPHLLFKKFNIIPDDLVVGGNSKIGKGNKADLIAMGMPYFTNKKYLDAKKIAEKVRQAKITEKTTFADIIDKGGNSENSLFWHAENGVLLKARPDFFNDNIIIDLKTSACADEYDFSCSIGKYGYHRQAYLQIAGLEILTRKRRKHFINLVVEKESPFLTASYRLDDDALELAKQEILDATEIYKKCLASNEWPSYQTETKEISLQRWYRS